MPSRKISRGETEPGVLVLGQRQLRRQSGGVWSPCGEPASASRSTSASLTSGIELRPPRGDPGQTGEGGAARGAAQRGRRRSWFGVQSERKRVQSPELISR